jgi:hypothetical protein
MLYLRGFGRQYPGNEILLDGVYIFLLIILRQMKPPYDARGSLM